MNDKPPKDPSMSAQVENYSDTSIRAEIIEALCKPLHHYRVGDDGDQTFRELFYDRTEARRQIEYSIKKFTDMTLIGNPGEGKSCLVHYMFAEAQKYDNIYPIILDWRAGNIQDKDSLVIDFIQQMLAYFKEIGKPLNMNRQPDIENLRSTFGSVCKHLKKMSPLELVDLRRLVIFLDDLDHHPHDYFMLLKEYFCAFTGSQHSIVILTGRKPLINRIRQDDVLRQAFHYSPHEIHLGRLDYQAMINHLYERVVIGKHLPQRIWNHIKDVGRKLWRLDFWSSIGLPPLEQVFPFDGVFYPFLSQVTGRNLRDAQRLLPDICKYQHDHKTRGVNFNSTPLKAYVDCCGHDRNVLLDLVSRKTRNKRKDRDGNSVLQVILEYFIINEVAGARFEREMEEYGIGKAEAYGALDTLATSPYSLVDPDFVYDSNEIVVKRFRINKKGKIYVQGFLNLDEYFAKLGVERRSNRSYLDGKSSELIRGCLIKIEEDVDVQDYDCRAETQK